MMYAGTHRDVKFSVHSTDARWKFIVSNESIGHYSRLAHAIAAAIQHIDRMLFEESRSRRA